ncbi:sensor histidine kinase [Sphingomonas alpina]|nr:ATP-binding protein [Sphingomonas alpina]
MTGTRLHALLRHVLLILALAGVAAPHCAAAQPAHAEAAGAGTRFDVMIAEAKAMMLADPAKTIVKAKQAEKVAGVLAGPQRNVGIATARWLQGEAHLRLNQIDEARPLINSALAALSAEKKPTKLKGDVLLSRGGLHMATTEVSAALADYQQAHNIFRDSGETRSRAIALLSIAALYQEAKDYQNALKYYGQALDVYQGDPQLQLSIYNNRGEAFKELERYDEAEEQFRKALDLAKTMNSPGLEAQIMRNIARGQLVANKLDAADATIREGWKLVDSGDAASNAQFAAVAAQAALQRGRLAQAQQLIVRSFAGVDPATTTLSFRANHQTAYDIFRKLGLNDAALTHLEALRRLDDQTTKLATSTNTALMAARFDYANQELRIAKLKADELQRNIEFERSRAEMQQFIFIGIALVTLIILSMLAYGIVTLRRSRNEVRAANIDLAATNDALGKALAAKTEFLATTSHEIRTPLNGILGMTQVMLADRKLSDPMRDRIGVVHSAGVTMRALVDDILDVAKMETGNMTIEAVALDLKATLRDVARLWEEQAKGRGIGFTLDLDAAPNWIEGDAARLRQIVFNLLSNALKFTESGAVTVRAAATGATLAITVSDTGIGVPADKQDIIFESFRQVDAGTTRKFGGTGLGLTICRNLARAMNGDVRVESVSGSGSSFTLELPLVLANPPEAVASAANEKGALLIVDRSPITRSMLRALLEARAGTVVFAGSVEEAVERLDGGGISQVLIDDATVKATGDVDAALRAIAHAAGDAHTSILWAAPDDAQRDRLIASGVDAMVAKPIAGAALADLLYPLDDRAPSSSVSRAA